ncbi:619_t:CDS:2 [Funneliformis mosseae]|uniref:619_t:CDS:1 n=1 Tax=Funneliformis mosseae TaxID=27381 RepID=A0A9N9A7E4_FUNMO|nr:619_t:CDS:2 [Funneliformis mosseae]
MVKKKLFIARNTSRILKSYKRYKHLKSIVPFYFWSLSRNLHRSKSIKLDKLKDTRRIKPSKSPLPSSPSPRRIIAIGDLHGDYEQTIKVLNLANIIDDKIKWSGGNGILVQTGDIVDRGPDCLKIYKLFERLQKEAKVAGGMVINLFGNHEFMNLELDWDHVTPEDIESFGSRKNRIIEFSSDGFIGKFFGSSLQVAAIVEDTLFVHGGVNLKWANEGIEKMNQLGASLVKKYTECLCDPEMQETGKFTEKDDFMTNDERDLLEGDGPFWHREYINRTKEVEEELDKVLEVLKVKRMVVGHTVCMKNIVSNFNGKVYIIDVGISSFYGGHLAALEIIGDKVREIYPEDTKYFDF